MKHLLLTGVLSAAAVTAAAGTQSPETKISGVDYCTPTSIKSASLTDEVKELSTGVFQTTTNSIKRLRSINHTPDRISTILKNSRNSRRITARAGYEYTLSESFEAWDGKDSLWTPEGWTVDMKGDVDRLYSWTPEAAKPLLPSPSDGNVYYCVTYSSDKEQDEWLISPVFTPGEEMYLSYWRYIEPLYLFVIDSQTVDFDKNEFKGEKQVAATLQVWAREKGGEWKMLQDAADEYKDMTFVELVEASPISLQKRTTSLAEFAGKEIQVAFRYVGLNGNTIFLDEIKVGHSQIEGVAYIDPAETLYWGFERSWGMSTVGAPLTLYPVNNPILWINSYEGDENPDFTWSYSDPESGEILTSTDHDLEVTYFPDYTSAATLRNNFHVPPTLTASAANAAPASYTSNYVNFQAGGTAELTFNDGAEYEGSLLPFSMHNEGVTFITVDDKVIANMNIPVFGYGPDVDNYWLNVSLNGAEKNPGDYNRIEGIANLFMPSAPIVINGITLHAYGKINADAEITASIYALNEEWSSVYSDMTKVATATCKGSDILAQYKDSKSYMCLPFDFDEPVVLEGTDEHPAYFIAIEDFRSEHVEFFAPIQSKEPNPNGYVFGYKLSDVDLTSHGVSKVPKKFKPLYYVEDGEYVDPYTSFAIGLNAEYPWLTTDCKSIELTNGYAPVEVALGSYYDGSKLTVEAPEGIKATVAGRYNNCKLSVKLNGPARDIDGNIVVSGPGVKVTIPVKLNMSGIDSVNADPNATVVGVYDVNGRLIDPATKGVQIIRYSDGTVSKSVNN